MDEGKERDCGEQSQEFPTINTECCNERCDGSTDSEVISGEEFWRRMEASRSNLKRKFVVNGCELTGTELYNELAKADHKFREENPYPSIWLINSDPSHLEKCAVHLAERENTLKSTLSRPEMVLQSIVNTERCRIANERGFQRLMNAHRSLKDCLLSQSPETRRKYWNWCEESGDFALFRSIDDLDEKVMAEYPDPEHRADGLAGANALQRKLSSGGTYSDAVADYQKTMETGQASRRARQRFASMQEDIRKALLEAEGNKTAAARILGISRAKMRRLTGEKM